MRTWLSIHVWQFEKLVILDGTIDDEKASRIRSASSMYHNVIYANERELTMPTEITDNTLRGLAWSLLPNPGEMLNSWVVIAHPDEFYLQRFADMALKAEAEGANAVLMSVLFALPHVKDGQRLRKAVQRTYSHFNILHSVLHCVSDYTYLENRMYKYESEDIKWGTRHSCTFPEHFNDRPATFNGFYIHYKLHNFDRDAIAADGQFTHSAWSRINDGVTVTSWSRSEHTEDFANLPEFEAELCSDTVIKRCNSENFDPACKMYLF